ncbi:NADH:flavin oxidoreductase/NADH oxidase [Kutzneria kofuensis]
MTEAAAVSPEGRISPRDAGIWNDEQVRAWRRIVDFVHGQGAKMGMQLGHAGRKASTRPPWLGRASVPSSEGGWQSVAPSAVAFGDYATPRELTEAEIQGVVTDFAAAAKRALQAGVDAIEVHAAHGYLIHQFYSPLSNFRTDGYGGDFDGRVRFLLEVATAVRAAIGDEVPLFTRLSATDWADGGWTGDDTVRLSRLLADHGVDLIDVSSGGVSTAQRIPLVPGYQVPFAQWVRAEAKVPTAAVGLITEPRQAEQIVATGAADVVFLARALLRDPHWPLNAARVLGGDIEWPIQYVRARLER